MGSLKLSLLHSLFISVNDDTDNMVLERNAVDWDR